MLIFTTLSMKFTSSSLDQPQVESSNESQRQDDKISTSSFKSMLDEVDIILDAIHLDATGTRDVSGSLDTENRLTYNIANIDL